MNLSITFISAKNHWKNLQSMILRLLCTCYRSLSSYSHEVDDAVDAVVLCYTLVVVLTEMTTKVVVVVVAV